MGILLILLSFCIYPIVLSVPTEQQAAFHGLIATDIFMYARSILICIGALCIVYSVRKVQWSYLFFLFFLSLSVIFSAHPKTAIFGTPNYYEGAIVIFAYFIFAMQKNFPEKAVKIAVYIVGAFTLLQILGVPIFNWTLFHAFVPRGTTFQAASDSVYSTFGNPNHLGLFCALLFPYFLENLDLAPTLVLLLTAIASQNRACWLAMLLTSLIQFRKHQLIVLAVTVAVLAPSMSHIMNGVESFHLPIKDTDISNRAYIWSETVPLLKHHWVTGSGPGNYALEFPQDTERKKTVGYGTKVVDRPHNLYLSIWHSSGFISLLIFLFMVFDLFHRCKDRAIKMGVLGFLIAGLFTDSVVSVSPFFFAMLGAGL